MLIDQSAYRESEVGDANLQGSAYIKNRVLNGLGRLAECGGQKKASPQVEGRNFAWNKTGDNKRDRMTAKPRGRVREVKGKEKDQPDLEERYRDSPKARQCLHQGFDGDPRLGLEDDVGHLHRNVNHHRQDPHLRTPVWISGLGIGEFRSDE